MVLLSKMSTVLPEKVLYKISSKIIYNPKILSNFWVKNSLGYFYFWITLFCGFKVQEDGKTMGLAPYGTDRYVNVIKQCIKLLPEGGFDFDKTTKKFLKILRKILKNNNHKGDLFQVKADIAYAGQEILERTYFHCLNYLYDKIKIPNLCLAGGIALNRVANGKIKDRTPFKNISIVPPAGDNGCAIGCALYGYYVLSDHKRKMNIPKVGMRHAFWGKSYSRDDILRAIIETKGIEYSEPDNLLQLAGKTLANGSIVGWFQGRSEVGPRALGNRSILCDPRRKEMKNILNERVKHREWFRPFAPAVLEEFASEYFECYQKMPYMLKVVKVKDSKRNVIPAVIHIDNTARIQTVSKMENLRFYQLIQEFYKLTNVPVILNTSFNIQGEPIVESPNDAINCFLGTSIDYLVLDTFFIRKSGLVQTDS